MQKTMAEVRKVAEAIGWSPETLARAWEAAGIAIAADPPQVRWEEGYEAWARVWLSESVPPRAVWAAAVRWCLEQTGHDF